MIKSDIQSLKDHIDNVMYFYNTSEVNLPIQLTKEETHNLNKFFIIRKTLFKETQFTRRENGRSQ